MFFVKVRESLWCTLFVLVVTSMDPALTSMVERWGAGVQAFSVGWLAVPCLFKDKWLRGGG